MGVQNLEHHLRARGSAGRGRHMVSSGVGAAGGVHRGQLVEVDHDAQHRWYGVSHRFYGVSRAAHHDQLRWVQRRPPGRLRPPGGPAPAPAAPRRDAGPPRAPRPRRPAADRAGRPGRRRRSPRPRCRAAAATTAAACATAPSRWNPHGATTTRSGAACRIRSQPVCTDGRPGPQTTGIPPAATDQVGHPVSGGEGRVDPLDRPRPCGRRPAGDRGRNVVEPALRSPATSCSARSAVAGRARRPSPMVPRTSSSVCGSSEMTSARQPR